MISFPPVSIAMYMYYDNTLSRNCTQDLFNAFNCTCVDGYTGGQCQTNIDDCVLKQPCLHEGVCYDLVNDYVCDCINDYIVSCDIRLLHKYMFSAFMLYNIRYIIIQSALESVIYVLAWVFTLLPPGQGL